MSIYFVFSDESGDYKPERDNNYTINTPFYIRTALIIDSSEWKELSEKYYELKKKFGISPSKEIKWHCLWQLWKFKNKGTQLPKDCEFLKEIRYKKLESFIENSILLIQDLKYRKIIITITNNSSGIKVQKKDLLKMHLQDIMERVELEFNQSANDLAIIFIDNVNETIDRYLREIYSEFFIKGDFIKKYSHIMDSLSIEYSHHSVAIQIVDFLSGCSLNFFKSIFMNKNFEKNFEFSRKIFKDYIFQYLRRSQDDELFGYGIKETPEDEQFRNELKNKALFIIK